LLAARTDEVEEILAELKSEGDPDSIELLIGLLDDQHPYDELMYALIHTIENFDDETYAKHILNTVPDFVYRAPRWASIVVMRILNSDETRVALIRECNRNASPEQKEALKRLLNSINEVPPEFLAKTVPLLGVL
jgi:hypothetical protein